MRVAVDARVLARRGNGIRNYTLEILKSLVKIDRRNEYFLYFDRSYKDGFDGPENLQRFVIRPGLSWPVSFPKILRRDKVDLLFSPVSILPLTKVCRSVTTIHDLSFEIHRSWFTLSSYIYLHLSYKNATKKADRIIAISKSTKEDLLKSYQIPGDKITVVYNGVDHNLFRPVRESESCERILRKYNIAEKFILYVGAINVRKNIPRLLKAYYKLKKMNFPHQLVMIGGFSGPKIDLNQILDVLGIRSDVVFLRPSQAELPIFYSMAELTVYPSLYEGFGFPILESMACGTPVVTSNVSSMPEVVGDAGLLINPFKVDELASAMSSLLIDEGLRLQLKMKGLKRSKAFTWKKAAQETMSVFKDTINT